MVKTPYSSTMDYYLLLPYLNDSCICSPSTVESGITATPLGSREKRSVTDWQPQCLWCVRNTQSDLYHIKCMIRNIWWRKIKWFVLSSDRWSNSEICPARNPLWCFPLCSFLPKHSFTDTCCARILDSSVRPDLHFADSYSTSRGFIRYDLFSTLCTLGIQSPPAY